MTEYRHFMDPVAGDVMSTVGSESHSFHYTEEVQVVPLDAVVIRREDLPEVRPGFEVDAYNGVGVGSPVWVADNATAEDHERIAKQHLAISLHLREHPPVDEPQVNSLIRALALEGNYPDGTNLRPIATSLYRAGIRVVDEP